MQAFCFLVNYFHDCLLRQLTRTQINTKYNNSFKRKIIEQTIIYQLMAKCFSFEVDLTKYIDKAQKMNITSGDLRELLVISLACIISVFCFKSHSFISSTPNQILSFLNN